MDDLRSFFLVGNIPGRFHSYDLRAFFSHFVEKGGFHCFHFRHRPEHIPAKSDQHSLVHDEGGTATASDESTEKPGGSIDAAESSVIQEGLSSLPETRTGTTCCVVAVKIALEEEFVQLYRGKNWTDSKGDTLPSLVRLRKLKTGPSHDTAELAPNGAHQQLEMEDLTSLPELRPPSLMPRGNVGTPLATFMALIRSCKLPSHVIRKLRLEFPKSRSVRRYGAVPLDYGPKTGGEVLRQYERQWSLKGGSNKESHDVTGSSSKKKKRSKRRIYENDDIDCTSANMSHAANNDVSINIHVQIVLRLLLCGLNFEVLVCMCVCRRRRERMMVTLEQRNGRDMKHCTKTWTNRLANIN